MVHTPARMGEGQHQKQAFPWHVGVFDSHCHPTDTLDSLRDVPRMRARVLTIMATREQDQELVSQAAVENGVDLSQLDEEDSGRSACQILPAFGWHPWFSHHMYDDLHGEPVPDKLEHYRRVLQPPPEDEGFIEELIPPQSLKKYLDQTRKYLEMHQQALIGEIGMDRSMRIPENTTQGRAVDPEPGITPGGRENRRLSPYKIDIEHQAKVLIAQLRLAGEMQRAVSVHGVAAHGLLYETLRSTWKGHEREIIGKRKQQKLHPDDLEEEVTGPKPFPPRICLHSYSGPPDTIRQYLARKTPAVIFFSFSQVINLAHGSSKALEAIRAVPDDRILVESDLHRAGERMDDLLAEIVAAVCEVKDWDLESGTKQLANNWKHFALGIQPS